MKRNFEKAKVFFLKERICFTSKSCNSESAESRRNTGTCSASIQAGSPHQIWCKRQNHELHNFRVLLRRIMHILQRIYNFPCSPGWAAVELSLLSNIDINNLSSMFSWVAVLAQTAFSNCKPAAAASSAAAAHIAHIDHKKEWAGCHFPITMQTEPDDIHFTPWEKEPCPPPHHQPAHSFHLISSLHLWILSKLDRKSCTIFY